MRLSDRPWADDDPDADGLSDGAAQPARSDELADRLTRLPPGHPSADAAGGADRSGDEPASDDLDAYDLDGDDLDADDLDDADPSLGEIGSGGPDGGAAGARGRPQRGAADSSPWGELGGPTAARSPYRPWFGADGASDPWFASPARATPG
jgi:hypothetical protein